MSDDEMVTTPCWQCGNLRPINAYCSATDPCRAAADEHAARMRAFTTGSPDEMVTMVGPNGSTKRVDRETAKAATALMADVERRVTEAYEQGKEVGRVNGAARLAHERGEKRMWIREAGRLSGELIRLRAIVASVRDVALASPTIIDPRTLADTVRRYCGNVNEGGRCYCGGCVL